MDMARVLIMDSLLFSRSPALEELLVMDEEGGLLRQVTDCTSPVAIMIATKNSLAPSPPPSHGPKEHNQNHKLGGHQGSGSVHVVGWKTIGLVCTSRIDQGTMNPQIVNAILDHSSTFENLKISSYPEFPSDATQRILCTAPRLKRLMSTDSSPRS